MTESPVIDNPEDFEPMAGVGAPRASPVINDSDEFAPLAPPPAAVANMPTPDQVLHVANEKRLDAVPFEFADIRALAQRILKRAQEQGQAKLEAARTQVAAMEKEACDKAYREAFPKGEAEGFAKGEKDGMAEAEKRIAAAIESEKETLRQSLQPVTGVLQQLTEAMNASRSQLTAQAEGDLLLLALDLARRLVGHELSVDPEAIKPLANECIGLVTERTGITARVNPEDYRVLEEFYPELKQTFPDLGPIQIIPDPEIERGGLYAATREAEVDMRLATRLAAFEEVILGYSGEKAAAPWSRIPPDAIAAAKQARSESAYALPPSDPEPAAEAAVPPGEPEAPSPEPTPEPSASEDAGETAAVPETAPEQPSPGQSPVGDDLADLADLADSLSEPPHE